MNNNQYYTALICNLIVLIYLLTILFPLINNSYQQISLLNGSRVNLAINELSVGLSPTGLINVQGIVYNNSTENVENLMVEVKLFDSDKNLISETNRYITRPSSIFKPEYSRDFDFLITANNVDSYTVSAYVDKIQ